MKVKYCKECKWSKPEINFEWNLRCHNPNVNSKDHWALGGNRMNGTDCTKERQMIWYNFPKCGRVGKLWEEK